MLRRHRVFIGLLILSIAVRVAVLDTFRPAIWYLGDSVGYVGHALHVRPDPLRPLGYSLLLAALRPFHDLGAVPVVQHLLALATAVLVYAVCRRLGLPEWLAALGSAPMLLEGLSLALAQTLMAETLFTALVLASIATAVVIVPAHRQIGGALAGLLLAGACLTREVGLPLVAVLVAVLVARQWWRAAAATVLAFSLPLLAYATWAQTTYGRFALTASGGLFRYASVAPFATCDGMRVPPSEQVLCRRPPVEQGPNWYLFNGASPLTALPSSIPVRSRIAGDFASRVLRHQPGTAVRYMARNLRTALGLPSPEGYAFPRYGEHLVRGALQYGTAYQRGPPQLRSPGQAATVLRRVQRATSVPVAAYVVALVLGLLAVLLPRTWSTAARGSRSDLMLVVLAGLALAATPAVAAELDVRYFVPVLPLACVAGSVGIAGLVRAGVSRA